MKTTKQLTTEEQLLKARAEVLDQARKMRAMKAHGKVLGMDTFSWLEPDWATLTTAIMSFPFPVHWVVDHELAKNMLDEYPEITSKIRSLLVFNGAKFDVGNKAFNEITNIACVDELADSLTLLKSMRKEKSVFLFTTQAKQYDLWETFDEFITVHR